MTEEVRKTSDLQRAFKEDGANKTHIGGQALLEGVMMRGKSNWAVAVRKPDGTVYSEEHELASGKKKNQWMYRPFVRGCRALVESFALSLKALEVAAVHAFGDEEPAEGKELPESDTKIGTGAEMMSGTNAGTETETESEESSEERPAVQAPDIAQENEPYFGRKELVLSIGLGLIFGVGIFIVAPAFLTNLLVGEYDTNPLVWNIIDGIIRVFIFLLYLWLVGRLQDIKRMFAYHGAEHKAIHCYENGMPLTIRNVRRFPRLHVRCGTAFLVMVMIIAILVYTIVPINVLLASWGVEDGPLKLVLLVLLRIVLLPFIAGLTYEITVKWAGQRPNNPAVRIVLWPGLQLQYLTTNEPDDEQIECAIVAMQRVLEREERDPVNQALHRNRG